MLRFVHMRQHVSLEVARFSDYGIRCNAEAICIQLALVTQTTRDTKWAEQHTKFCANETQRNSKLWWCREGKTNLAPSQSLAWGCLLSSVCLSVLPWGECVLFVLSCAAVGAELFAFASRFRNSATCDWLLTETWGRRRDWWAGPLRVCRPRPSFFIGWIPSSKPLAVARAITSCGVSVISGSSCRGDEEVNYFLRGENCTLYKTSLRPIHTS